MNRVVPLNCSSSTFPVPQCSRSRSICVPIIHCSSRNNGYIPKLEPFSRSKIDRAVKDPPLIQKSENQIADYCVTVDGDDSYSCWQAYFELKDLEKEAPKEEVERLIIEAGGVKSLIGCIHGVAAIRKSKKERGGSLRPLKIENVRARSTCPIPDGLPKSREELEEEERARMPDSPFTRLLRAKGRNPAWYTPVPEHETD
ncbi:CCG-binding protein 1-like [Primulina tabacum]|uniref:CCG-binding protein 1-like n=1 Tax=Primulina tabacum TaxID=48773 RepID=UPI003F5A6F79